MKTLQPRFSLFKNGNMLSRSSVLACRADNDLNWRASSCKGSYYDTIKTVPNKRNSKEMVNNGQILFVGNLKYVSPQDVLSKFENIGHVQAFFYNPKKGPFMFIKMASAEDAATAVDKLHKYQLGTQEIIVKYSINKTTLKQGCEGTIWKRAVRIKFYGEKPATAQKVFELLKEVFPDVWAVNDVKNNRYEKQIQLCKFSECLRLMDAFNMKNFYGYGCVTIYFVPDAISQP